MGESVGNGLTEVKVDVAVLNERYLTLQATCLETKSAVQDLNVKFDEVLDTMRAAATERALDAQRRKWKSAVWTGVRHIATLAGAVVLAKKLNIPIDFGM